MKTKEKIIKLENWERDFNNEWYLWDYSSKLDTYNTCGEAVKSFIRQLLSQQKQEIMEEIEKLPTGMFDSTPYKEDLFKKLTKQNYEKREKTI